MPRKTDPEFMRDLLVLLTEALVFNEKAFVKAKNGSPPITMLSELAGNKTYLQQAMDRLNVRIRRTIGESRRAI